MEYSETVLKELGLLGRYRARIIKTQSGDTLLDIREHVNNKNYVGFTKKGIRLDWTGVMDLERELPKIIEFMDQN